MSEENAPEQDKTMPSVGKQLMVMALIVVGIVVVLGGGFMLSMWLG
jgi:flagellar basal body-associated protein FliL